MFVPQAFSLASSGSSLYYWANSSCGLGRLQFIDEALYVVNDSSKDSVALVMLSRMKSRRKACALGSTRVQGELTVLLPGVPCSPHEQISHLISQFIGQDSSWL